MLTIPVLLAKVKSLNLELARQEAIKSNAFEGLKLNQDQLKLKGQKSDGTFLKEYASGAYAEYKNFLNAAPGLGRPDLLDTGAFQGGFYARIQPKSVIFGSVDSKSDKLEKKYGKEIFGLTKDNTQLFAVKYIIPELKQYISKETGLKYV